MSLLPRTAEEFSSAEYWERFFKKRGEKAFEWYGDYNKLCGVLHKYIKVQDKVLVVGCGNSELSEQMYDVGYKHLTNIDISETVVTHMNQRNAERRPGLTFQQVDATQTPFEDASYQAALDKGTLDAIASEEKGALARNMLTEVGRVLCVGGRYVCVTLAQESVIKLAVEQFVELGWAVRLHCLQEECGKEEDSFALPVFVLVCTKFRQPMPMPILEICLGEDGVPTRHTQVSELLSAVREHQAYSVLRRSSAQAQMPARIYRSLSATPRLVFQDTLSQFKIVPQVPSCHDQTSLPFLLFLKAVRQLGFTAPVRAERQLAASANFRRLLIVTMHRNQEYMDMQAVQSELSPVVMDLAPPGMPANQQVPFLSVGGDLGWREEVSRGVSELSGEYCIENVKGEDGELYRRLVFLSNAALVQSESRLVLSNNTSNHKKKNKKKASSTAPSTISPTSLSVDSGFLCCAHHEVMVAGLAMLGVGMPQMKDDSLSVLLVGLGGGGLPQFLRDFVPNVTVEVVELDPVVLEVAKQWFGFRPDDRLTVTLGDGLERICALKKEGGRLLDVIMFDVDNKDSTVGMSCPPAGFVETSVLQKVSSLLTPRGVFMLNLVCRDSALRKTVLERVSGVFPTILSRKIEGEVNEVLLCFCGENEKSNAGRLLSSLNEAAKSLQSALGSKRTGANRSPHIDIAELLKDLKVE
ncbi:hypothetical protein Q5P01_016295 [Channa striata]|uniref:eEF1A lysine and N-terminal methyltransferase n=1 Tax=Channa striata TaxID=64152 RepID=A0AA88SGD4_CHASR|nr:hypothetical protein Q5P01_016295 [Channa striata]